MAVDFSGSCTNSESVQLYVSLGFQSFKIIAKSLAWNPARSFHHQSSQTKTLTATITIAGTLEVTIFATIYGRLTIHLKLKLKQNIRARY